MRYRSKSIRGTDAARNFCRGCGGLVFGGEVGSSDSFTVYARSLDHPLAFEPRVAIFPASRPAWAVPPPGPTVLEELPP
jgi:hypothetical protein